MSRRYRARYAADTATSLAPTQRSNLALLLSAIIKKCTLCLFRLARTYPTPARERSPETGWRYQVLPMAVLRRGGRRRQGKEGLEVGQLRWAEGVRCYELTKPAGAVGQPGSCRKARRRAGRYSPGASPQRNQGIWPRTLTV